MPRVLIGNRESIAASASPLAALLVKVGSKRDALGLQ